MSQLHTTYQQIEQGAQALETLLSQESHVLKSRDIDSLERSITLANLADKKSELVQTLDTLERNRQFYLRSESATALEAQWQNILAILQRCQSLNQQNGKDISNQTRYTRRALEILGMEDASNPMYGADGNTTNSGRRHSLGMA
jgi:flagellar biosynthesis/type III secretory pathway chaperone